ncbi:MAG: CsbD family protein [Acidimicrobiia bacterium]
MKFEASVQEMRGRLKEAWGALTDDDIDRAEGQWDRLVGTIREKAGESIDTISAKIDKLIDRVHEAGSIDTDS